MSGVEEIRSAIPHRAPMLLVDEIIDQVDGRIICAKTFSADEFFFQGHYPDNPIVPGVILCEAALQAGAILLKHFIAERPGGVPVVTRMNEVKWKRPVRPAESIRIEVDLVERVADAFFLKAKVTCQDKLAVRFDFAFTVAMLS